MEDDALATLFDFRVMRGDLVPGEVAQGLANIPIVEIVIAKDQPFAAVEPVENLARATDIVAAEIAKVPNDIVRTYDRIPGLDQVFVHLLNVRERTKAQHQLMAKMGVTGEIVLGKSHS